ncbi:anti-sigma-F factor Fin [Halalkalibacillus halophilus]|uniref:anti-sigma-F factor Fin n=1 Tax=Halalkalibacillus halophilus TaxID=392827 RepID=UPI00040A3BB8|nr:anti-sigma-F factor Fin [Halalkalibacillus halophilus]
MAVSIQCKYCRQSIGYIDDERHITSYFEQEEHSSSEWMELLEHKSNGEYIMKLTCEYCEDTLAQNPELHENDHFIH